MGPVVRITVVRMENITTGIALDSPTPCQRCPTSQLMGSFRFQIFSYLDSLELLEGFTTQAPTVRPPVVGVGAVVIMSTSTLGAEVEE